MTWIEFSAGWIGGVLGLVMGHPLDTLKVRQHLTKSSMMNAIQYTLRYEGLRGFYKGMLVPLITIGLNNAVFFGIYANTLRYFEPDFRSTDDITQHKNWGYHAFNAGCFASIFQCAVTNPAEIIKIRIQAHTGNKQIWGFKEPSESKITDNVRRIYQTHGLRGFYKGMTALMWRDVPASGLYILSYCMLDDYLKEKNFHNTLQRNILAGAFAGIVSWVPVMPFDVVKSRMQADSQQVPKYHGMLDCMRKSYKAEGIGIFGQGFVLSLTRAIVVNAAVFAGYEQFIILLS